MDAYTHPEWLGFLKSIRECPRDTVRRLAAADWLDDNGEGVRAEIVRLQIAWAELPASHRDQKRMPASEVVRRRTELRQRWESLLRKYDGTWTERMTWDRGLPSSCTSTWQRWRDNRDTVLKREPIRSVRITNRLDFWTQVGYSGRTCFARIAGYEFGKPPSGWKLLGFEFSEEFTKLGRTVPPSPIMRKPIS